MEMKKFRPVTTSVAAVSIFMALSGNSCGDTTPTEPANQTGEAFCSTFTGPYGHLFFCPSTQSNLQTPNLPKGYLGFCQTAANASIGLVGYSVTTYNGGASPVDTYSNASTLCTQLGGGGLGQCSAIATRMRQ